MAVEVREFPAVVPAGTLASAPQTTPMKFPVRTVQAIEVEVPPGPRGEVGFRIGAAGVQLIPYELGKWVITDGRAIRWALERQHESGSWELVAYNTGTFDHTIVVRFEVGLATGVAQDATSPIPASTLNTIPGGVAVSPSVEVPPPPRLPPLPPLPVLQPPPTLTLPVPGGQPGARTAPPKPQYNWWYDTMGRLLTYPDQTSTTRFDEVFLLPDGSVGWYAFPGGAGEWVSYNQPAGSLGGQFTDVSASFTLFQGVIRLNIVGTAPDGTRSLKVMNAQDFSVIADWRQQSGGQSREMALVKRVQLGGQ
jgi:hypothetical protein